jgi:serine/threonine protein phosphatase PrpC
MESIRSRERARNAECAGFEELMARFYENAPSTTLRVEFGAPSQQGLVRGRNEDGYYVVRRRRERDILLSNVPVERLVQCEQEAFTMVVADGLGGHAFGDLASYLALRVNWDLGKDEIKWAVKMNRREADELKLKAGVLLSLVSPSPNQTPTGVGATC